MLQIFWVAVVIALLLAGPVGWIILIAVVLPAAIVWKIFRGSWRQVWRAADRQWPRFAAQRAWLAEHVKTVLAVLFLGGVAFLVILLLAA